jgi:hypothetical protein
VSDPIADAGIDEQIAPLERDRRRAEQVETQVLEGCREA